MGISLRSIFKDAMCPKVTVLMALYNGEKYVGKAIESILSQTFKDFELIIINDGSTDRSAEIVKSYRDERIYLYDNGKNLGITATRNKGIELSHGKYIAILDCDDIALPDRLKEQAEFLDNNPEYALIGSNVQMINEKGEYIAHPLIFTVPPEEIPMILLFKNYFTHSSVMMRKSYLLPDCYNTEFQVAEDFDLIIRLSRKYKLGHIQKILTLYREHETNICKYREDLMSEATKKILSEQLKNMGVNYTDDEFYFYFLLGKINYRKYFSELMSYNIAEIDKYLMKLLKANKKTNIFRNKSFEKYLFEYWKLFYPGINKFHVGLLKSPFYKYLGVQDSVKFVLKCLIGWGK